MKLSFLVFICIFIPFFAPKTEAALRDSKGKEFWITFLPNFHNSPDLLEDSLYIFIAADVQTNGTIEYKDSTGKIYTKSFSVNAGSIYTFRTVYSEFELFGFNDSGQRFDSLHCQSEKVAKQVFHITADQEITVYGLNQANTTSDAFLALPADALGTEYMVLAYKSDGKVSSGKLTLSSTPSEFAIVATKDSTDVTIFPSTPTYRLHQGKGDQIRLRLMRGDVFLVQSQITSSNLNSDLTGTRIKSSAPIAVFAGQQRATIPVELANQLSSRDHVIEQMPPIEVWGRSALITPYAIPFNATKDGYDLYRVLTAFDSTSIFVNGVSVGIFNSGEYYEQQLINPAHVTSNHAILVAQYKKTSQPSGADPNIQYYGDPFSMIIPPSEQYMNSYRVINAQASDDSHSTVYNEQYLAVVIPTTHISSLKITPIPFATPSFNSIPQSIYSYANIPVGDGVHFVSADTGIGVYVYGYGVANSYGYVGGLALQRLLDFRPPEIAVNLDCFSLHGAIYDSSIVDTGILSVESPDSLKKNVNVSIDSFVPFADSTHFSVKLQDIFQDGSCKIIALDSILQKKEMTVQIFGFTVKATKAAQNSVDTSDILHDKVSKCYDIEIENYGKGVQIIDTIVLSQKIQQFSIISQTLPLILQPNEKKIITVCCESDAIGTFSDTLILVNSCAKWQIANFTILVRKDTLPPAISRTFDNCHRNSKVTISEIIPSDWGIASVIIYDTINCSVSYNTSNTVRLANYIFTIKDQKFDASYALIARDSVGNMIEFRDTIQGFTVNFASIPNRRYSFSIDSVQVIGGLKCSEVSIQNFGKLPFTIDKVRLSRNIMFSAPQNQFPIVIPAGESRTLEICFHPIESLDSLPISGKPHYRDTVRILYNCVTDSLLLEGDGLQIIQSGTGNCNIHLKLVTTNVPFGNFVEYNFPNPAADETTLRIGLSQAENVEIKLYNTLGRSVGTVISQDFQAGIFDLVLDTSKFENGAYFYEVKAGVMREIRQLLISR